ncbi:phosphoenolpyruvate carboxykinase (ATP) [Solitalea koreensis]|uniref:Phosphoenolpyruvate carboxykinase (ATP) n=1 Tax=Solitalea koreensis TaxID=543615 RepID=A0A521C5Y8_9SPHI|nr:phosphoenolpyruvate carboxykinase (ATP) [Solitalea koreensis]SMO54866.1 phosphoenolpyruvate carboxykinase (ATP) [Solitalea koreensis]
MENELGFKAPHATLKDLGINNVAAAYWNLTPSELIEKAVVRGEGHLVDSGALAIDTGEFTGRSPKDRFIVADEVTENAVWWGDINIKFSPEKFDALYNKMTAFLNGKTVFVRDSYACADPAYKLNIRVVAEAAYQSLFANNLFLRPTQDELLSFNPEWTIIAIPSFMADPAVDGTRQHNFAVLNFTRKVILIGGTGYTGEIKKGIFSALNFILPHQKNVLSMHCSANIGKDGDTAIFFGLSGTGKTTLSADPNRALIGDDEHGWAGNSVFNFEGGCYAKCVDLTAEKEPQIFNAIKFGSLLENVRCFEGTSTVDFSNITVTENTRVSYPIEYIDNAVRPSVGTAPKNIFFLTADAFGVLPPISKLTKGQAMFHFISGYTAKVAGTEAGVTEPQATFSAGFGKAFLPLHPTKYADLLGKKMDENKVNVWLINTGWTGGPYGVGSRMKLAFTRAMITAALNGELDNVDYQTDSVFGLHIPITCPNVPSEILNPVNTWADKEAYAIKAHDLAGRFIKNFEQFADAASAEIKEAMPKVTAHV